MFRNIILTLPLYLHLLVLGAVAIAHDTDDQPCSFTRPDYSVEWGYDSETDRVIFSLKAHTDRNEFLTGLAFGSKRRLDMLGVYVDDGKLGVMDGSVTRSGIIERDAKDNADSITFDYDKGVVSAEIARTLKAVDPEDSDLTGCVTFHFPSGSSVFDAKHKSGGDIGNTIEKKVCDIADKCALNSNGERKSDVKSHKDHVEDEFDKEPSKKRTDSDRGESKLQKTRAEEEIPDEHSGEEPKEKESEPEDEPRKSHTGNGSKKEKSAKGSKGGEADERSVKNDGGDHCSYSGKDFTVEWHYDQTDDRVIFDVSQDIAIGKRYTAIGIGPDMKDLDIAIVLLRDGHFDALNDYHANGYGSPKKDEVQDFDIHADNTSTNDRTHIQFSRKINTGDDEDASLDGCVTLQFAINAGSYDSDTVIHKHDHTPIAHRVCDIKTKCHVGLERNLRELEDGTSTETSATEPSEEPEGNSRERTITKPSDDTDSSGELTTSSRRTEGSLSSSESETSTSEGNAEDVGESHGRDRGHSASAEKTECPANHSDLEICTKYFDEYYAKVAVWAKDHNETMEAQNGRACSLLRKTAKVPTLCCHIYTDKCADSIDNAIP